MHKKKIITFGEIMLRLSTQNNLRITQSRSFDVFYGGGEANVAVSLANFGLPVEFVTRLPENDLGAACEASLRSHGVETKHVLLGGERLGVYFLESGISQRPSKVIYDRGYSSFSTIDPGMINWKSVFADVSWFHWTGITPAISESVTVTLRKGLKIAHEMGICISVDINFRKNLWKWGKKASDVMPELVRYSDVIIGNEEDAEKVFGIHAPNTDVTSGRVNPYSYQTVCDELAKLNPLAKRIAITLRGSKSASYNSWSAVLWNKGEFFIGPEYDIFPIVDRVGGGDSFAAGLIYGLNEIPDIQECLKFAIAASCLKHTVWGDFNEISKTDVENLLKNRSGRIDR